MTGRSEPDRDGAATAAPHAFDRLARAAQGLSRRQLLKLSGGLALTGLLPARARAVLLDAPLARAAAKTTGTCPTPARDVCQGGVATWTPSCQHSFSLGLPSQYNGCGPQGGIDLPVFGRGDYVPDNPFELASFFDACKGHDCCYGSCGHAKADCDTRFLADMVAACEARWPTSTVAQSVIDGQFNAYCLTVAQIYYEAVSGTQTGQDAYDAGQTEVCGCCIDCPTYAQQELGLSADDAQWYIPCPVPGTDQWVCTDGNQAENCGSCGNQCASYNCTNGVCVD